MCLSMLCDTCHFFVVNHAAFVYNHRNGNSTDEEHKFQQKSEFLDNRELRKTKARYIYFPNNDMRSGVWCLLMGWLALPWKSLHLCTDEQKAQYVHELFLIQNSKSLDIFRFEIAFLGIGSMNLYMFSWTNSFFYSTSTSTRDICCNWSSSRLDAIWHSLSFQNRSDDSWGPCPCHVYN